MKPSTLNSLRLAAGILAATSSALLAQTATTPPVGFITLAVAGTGGAGSNQLSFRGLGLTRPVEYQGSAESVGSNSVVDNEATWTNNQFNGAANACYLEITSGTGVGTIYDISATNAATKTITLSQNLAAGVTAPVTFTVKKHWTIGSIFGPLNSAGLQGGDSTTADQILIYNGTGYNTYYFFDDGIDRAWVNSGGADATNEVIYPDDGLIIRRKQSSTVNVVLMGSVKTGSTSFPVFPGVNFIANPYAAPMTLGSSGLRTGNPATGVQGGDSTSADQILIYNGTGYNTYYFFDDGIDQAWVNAANGSDASTVPIPVGSSIIIKRRGASGFNWVSSQHPASFN